MQNALRVLVALGCALVLLLTFDATPWEEVVVEVDGARVPVFLKDGDPDQPVVLLTPGAYLPGRFLIYPATDFHRMGFGVVLVDLNRVPRPKRAIEECLTRLRAESRLGTRDFVLYAHSASVTPAFAVARGDSDIKASVIMGYDPAGAGKSGDANNVLLVFGVFDDYIEQKEMLTILASTGGESPEAPGIRRGDFSEGSARKLVISGLSNHGGEPFDPYVIRAASRWFREACRLPTSTGVGFSSCLQPMAWCGLASLVGWFFGGLERNRSLAFVMLVTALLAAGGCHPLAGLVALAALFLKKSGTGGHFICLLLAAQVVAFSTYFGAHRGGSFVEWVRCVFWTELVALPCQVGGLLIAARGEGGLSFLTLVGVFALVCLAACRWPESFQDRADRWTRFCVKPHARILVLIPLLAYPRPGLDLLVGTVVYLGSVAALDQAANRSRANRSASSST